MTNDTKSPNDLEKNSREYDSTKANDSEATENETRVNILKNRKFLLLLLILIAAVLVFYRTIDDGFLLDDHFIIESRMEILRNPASIPAFFMVSYSGLESVDMPYYRPIVNIINSLNAMIMGPFPESFHLLNLIFHLINITLLFFLLHHMTRKLEIAFWATAFFAIHPLVGTSVAWISGRTDIIALFFMLITMHFLISWGEKRKEMSIILASVFYLLALFTKEISYFLPFAALFYFWLSTGRKFRDALEIVLPLALAFVLYFILKASLFFLVPFHSTFEFANILKAPSVFTFYLARIFFPARLIFIPNIEDIVRISVTGFIGLGLFIAFAIVIFKAGLKKLVWGLFWFLFFIAPVVQLFSFSRPALYFFYVPIIGILVVVVGVLERISERLKTKPYMENAIFIILLTLTAISSVHYINQFSSQKQLAKYTFKLDPDNRFAAGQLGFYKYAEGEYEQALEHYKIAHSEDRPKLETLNRLGMTYQKLGNYESAEKYFKKALELRKSARTHRLLGKLYMAIGDHKSAIENLHWAVRIRPTDYKSYADLTLLFGNIGDMQNAKKAFDYAIEIEPDYAEAYANLGYGYFENGEYKKADEFFEMALMLDPNDSILYRDAGVLAINYLSDSSAAYEYFRQYLKLAPSNPQLKAIQDFVNEYEKEILSDKLKKQTEE